MTDLWRPEYSLGLDEIDLQHRRFFRYLERLHAAMRARKSHEAIATILHSLSKYGVEHFATEEREMQKNNYPDFDSHREEHQRFIRKIEEFRARYDAGSIALSVDVLLFMNSWLSNHILGVDAKYVPYLKRIETP